MLWAGASDPTERKYCLMTLAIRCFIQTCLQPSREAAFYVQLLFILLEECPLNYTGDRCSH